MSLRGPVFKGADSQTLDLSPLWFERSLGHM